MSRRGSTGNVIAALASFFIPGLGQLFQGRLLRSIFMFVLAGVMYFIFWPVGVLVHLWAILNAAVWRGPRK